MLEVKNIHLSYDKEVLNNISFDLKQSQFLGIVGKSGGGKSSLLKIIGGFVSPDRGEVIFQGKKLRNANELLVPGYANIAVVHQDFGLDLYHTVKENIREKVLYLPVKFQDKLIAEMFDLLDLEKLANQKAIELSGGEQQRLTIARALVSEAELILLDEPFVHLDTPMRRRLMIYLEQLKEIRNTSFILVTHNGEEVLTLCDEVLYIKNGVIKRKGKPEKFYERPKSREEAEFFGPINAVVLNGKRKLFRPDQYARTNKAGEKLEVTFLHEIKNGPLFNVYFTTQRNESVLLFNFESMKNTTHIYV